MKKETLKSIFNFIEEKETHKTPFLWKWLNNEPLTEDDLIINDDLDLSNRKITSLPEGLKVGRDLNIQYSFISSLPKGLKVYGDLNIDSSKLSRFSDEELSEMIIPGFILGKIHRQ